MRRQSAAAAKVSHSGYGDEGDTGQLRPASPLRRRGNVADNGPPSLPMKRSSIKLMRTSSNLSKRFPARPTTSPHATHAMVLQLQENHDRLERACASTYQHALKPPPERPETSEGTSRKSVYCRARIMQSNRDCFQPAKSELAGAPPPSFSTAVGVKDCVLPAAGEVYVSFHQTTPRTSEYLFNNSPERARRMRMLDSIASSAAAAGTAKSSIVTTKDHFALGPGQYDVPVEKPSGLNAAAKFSPSDRFHENYSTDKPGPGQYITNDTLLTPRAAVAVFSQKPRQTELGSVVSPTANIVSSYYYVPDSTFDEGSKTSHHLGWSRTARFKSRSGRHERALIMKPSRQSNTDYIAKNMRDVQRAAAQYRLKHGSPKKASQNQVEDQEIHAPPPESLRRRSSLVAVLSKAQGIARTTLATKGVLSTRERMDLMLQSWITIAFLSNFQAKMARMHSLTSLMERVRAMKTHKLLSVTFASWKKLDAKRQHQYAAELVVRNALRCRMWIRIEKRRQHASILRQFLSGLSFEVRFSLAMKRIKRKIQLIQRWWRHVQLMVRAREEALYHKWIAVENRLRLEYINQMPHLHRIFQPPAGTTAASNAASTSGGMSFSGQGNTHASDLQLHKLLNLPDQRRWYTGRFVLSSDGSFRGFSTDNNEPLVEVKNFRSHYHDVSGSGLDETSSSGNGGHFGSFSASSGSSSHQGELQSYSRYTNSAWKPFLMLFRQGAFRFVVVTSLSPLPAEILSWKDKVERLMVQPNMSGMSFSGSISGSVSGSISMPSGSSFSLASGSSPTNGSYSDLSFFGSVSELVEVSMQSGILAPAASDPHSHVNSHGHRLSASQPPQRGKFQARVRSIRQRNRSGVSVADGTLSYYVVDLLKDFPKVPSAIVWHTIREKLREKRKAFRAEIYRYKLEMFHYHQHQEQIKHMHVLDKFRDFFTLERPRRPHFRSLISNRKMESLIRSTVEQVKNSAPANPRILLDSTKL